MLLLLELGAAKDELSSLQSQAGKDKEAIEEDYQKALELIFAYGYECCVFKHNICGDQPELSDGMHDSSYETPENSNFLKNGKIVILVKIRNFSKSRMTKWTSPLESSREI